MKPPFKLAQRYLTELFMLSMRINSIMSLIPLFHLTWIIHESRLLQMRGTGYEAVVLHRKCPVTKQMQ